MTLKARLYATALAIGLSTPAAAATITLSSAGIYDYHVIGSVLEPWLSLTHSLLPDRPVLEPWHIGDDPALRGSWSYQFDLVDISAPFASPSGGLGRGACLRNFSSCVGDPENFGGIPGPNIGDILQITYSGFQTFGLLDGVHRDLQITMPGVMLSQNPLPASWVLLASMLGLGGLFRWAKHRVVAP